MPKINIIEVNDFDYIEGGASKIAVETANLLSENPDYKVYFFSGTNSSKESFNNKEIKLSCNQEPSIKSSNKIKGAFSNIYNFHSRAILKRTLKHLDKNNTIIHYHGWTKILSSSVFDIAFKMGFKTILTTHECFSACPNGVFYDFKIDKVCTKRALSLECLCSDCDYRSYSYKILRSIRMFVQRDIVGMNRKIGNVICVSDLNKELIKPYFDTNTCFYRINNPSSSTYKKGLKENYYLFVGRIEHSKGIIDFCECIESLCLKGIVIGDGELLEECKRKYKNIIFLGWQKKETISEYLVKAKCLIFPSLAYESFGLSILDSLKAGTPVICSDVCGAKFLIKEGQNGFVYTDYNDLLSKIRIFETNSIQIDDDKTDFSSFSNAHYQKQLGTVFENIICSRKV